MLVMDMTVVMMAVIMPVVMRHARMGMGFVVTMIIVMLRGDRHRRHQLRRPQRKQEAAALGPDQPGTERRDQGVARDLDRPLRALRRFRHSRASDAADLATDRPA